MEEIKQVILVRNDLDMGKGKLAAQVAHASIMSYLIAVKENKEIVDEWMKGGQKKIVLKVDDDKAIKRLFEAFKFKKIPCALVNDAGLTQLPPGTITTLGVGPWKKSEIDFFTSALKLL
ncbi:MAG: peptidyl-tRNA hydrolase Pth2 [Candidatus Micrarchaeota archaeon]|nr:peptidyl-tRNA hydrolase Pth2 [Candidatus Micrarchaeota archaeon]MDE1834102.1 peptidyl-tRNA hydrolase Pth2 [Candidatus Micrarchaeota archaeon]MDE1859346.1 peptidyl-tRNA hydrolase Pth2 [Candidatus Micrarchaeota archaeon]